MSMTTSAIRQAPVHDATQSRSSIKVAYLATTFPKLTETFVQREVRALGKLGVELEIFSLWGGERRFEESSVRLFPKAKLLTLLWWLPYWLVRKPDAFVCLLRDLSARSVPSLENLGETLIGVGFAVTHAAMLSKQAQPPDLIHATWATMPATAAQVLARLIDKPFTMGAHAYDVYRNGGDWLLPRKLERAARIVTSTEMTREELVRRGADPNKVALVRRGLYPFPKRGVPRRCRSPLRILSVSRLVEKKGVFRQLDIYAEMMRRSVAFEARIVGDGPLAEAVRARTHRLGLSGHVSLLGSLAFDDVLEQYAWADLLVFTGEIAGDGDRDGLPNVILEAMATGTPVVAGDAGAVPELVRNGRNGVLVPSSDMQAWVRAFVRLRDDELYYRRICHWGRLTVERNNDAVLNAKMLLEHFRVVLDAWT